MAKRGPIPDYGTVEYKGNVYYRTRITDADGKRVALYAKTREELYDKVIAAKHEIEDACFRRETPTVKEYAEKWLLMQSANIRRTTLIGYTSKVNKYIIKPIGLMYIADVTEDDLKITMVNVAEKSHSVYRSVQMIMKCIFNLQ